MTGACLLGSDINHIVSRDVSRRKPMQELRGRTALVTGASRGIGVYIARALAKEGMNLVLAARSTDELGRLAEELRAAGHRVLIIPADLGDRASLRALAEQAEAQAGGVDVLVNNAGVGSAMPYDKLTVGEIDQTIEVNLRAPMVLSRLLLPHMIRRRRGHIVNIASIAGLLPVNYCEPYGATKHGLVGFTRSLRATAVSERWPVGCSAVCPGFVSNVGMYADMQKEFDVTTPAAFGTSRPENVARQVVRAIKHNVPEIVVNPTPIRPLVALALVVPRSVTCMLLRLGGAEVFGVPARKRAAAKA